MKAVIKKKLYDTDDAIEVTTYNAKIDTDGWPLPMGYQYDPFYTIVQEYKLYKTPKGNYFSLNTVSNAIIPKNKHQAKEIIRLNDPLKYISLFGGVEKA